MDLTEVLIDGSFESGSHNQTQPLSPPGTLSMGLPFGDALHSLPQLHQVSVLSRIYTGSGNVIQNEGLAGDGQLIDGNWETDVDKVFLKDPHIVYGHHSSMVGITTGGGPPPTHNFSAAFVIRNWKGGTLFHKPEFLRVQMDPAEPSKFEIGHSIQTSSGKKSPSENVEITFVVQVPLTAHLGNQIAEEKSWVSIGVRLSGGQYTVFINGESYRVHQLDNRVTQDPGHDLHIGREYDLGTGQTSNPFQGDIDQVVYFGGSGANNFLSSAFPTTATWYGPITDLGSSKILSRITHQSFISRPHNVQLEIRMTDDGGELKQYDSEAIDLKETNTGFCDGQNLKTLFSRGLLKGRFFQPVITFTRPKTFPFLPYVKNLRLFFR